MSKKQEAKFDIKLNVPVAFKIVESKADGEQGIVEAYVSIFNNVDLGGDIILQGAFAESLAKKFPKGVWSHNWDLPIAKTLEAREDSKGLYIKGQFNLDTQRGKEAYSDVKFGTIDEFSIGFRVQDDEWRDDGVRVIKKAKLYEWSPVLAGMNPETEVISVKSDEDVDEKGIIEDELNVDRDDQMKKWKMLSKMDDVMYKFYDVYLRATTNSADFSTHIAEVSDLLKGIGDDYEAITQPNDNVYLGLNSKSVLERIEKTQKENLELSGYKVEKVKTDLKSGTVILTIKNDEGVEVEKVFNMSDNYKKFIQIKREQKALKLKVDTSEGEGVTTRKTILRIRDVAKQNLKASQYLLRITKN